MAGNVKNYVTFVVDRSGSMEGFRQDVPRVFQNLVNTLKENGKKLNQQTRVAVQYFDDRVDEGPAFQLIDDFTVPVYYTRGMTALNDAVISAVQNHKRRVKPSLLNADIAHLIIVLTDGAENASKVKSSEEVQRVLATLPDLTLAINVPQGTNVNAIAKFFGIDPEAVNSWALSRIGFEEASTRTVAALNTYALSRSTGMKKVTKFYATTDLSGVSRTDLKDCDDVSSYFKPIQVEREERIDEFIQRKTGRPYVRGTAFYQLTKREDLQAHKDVILKEKTSSKLYGGPKVREVLGLPRYQDGQVTPGNHANFDIYVQSTSDNRKLVRGTNVLVVK